MNDQAKPLAGDLNAYDRAPEGTRWPALSTHVDRQRQDRYHLATDVEGAGFGGLADASIFAQDVSRAIANAGLPNDGRILVGQRIFQTGRVGLGEILSVEAMVCADGASPRGRILNCNIAFRRADNTVPLRMATEHLLPYAEMTILAPERTSGATPHSDPTDAMEAVGGLHLTPEKVAAYADEVGNLIHSDPNFAHARGFRAPIAQGLMQLTALHGAAVNHAAPWEMDLAIRFLCPVFWDSELTLYADAQRRLYRCVDQGGKLTAEAHLHHLTTEDMEP